MRQRRIAPSGPQITDSKLNCTDLFASKRLRAGALREHQLGEHLWCVL